MSATDQDSIGECDAEAPLEIPRSLLQGMIDHCLRDTPLEACGLLGGTPHRARTIYPLRNQLNSASRYDADPNDLIRAVRAIRQADAEIVAIYHSHPRWAAIPSRTDLAENHYGDVPRIIVSLLDDRPVVRIWRLGLDRFEELPWRVIDDSRPVEPQGPIPIDC